MIDLYNTTGSTINRIALPTTNGFRMVSIQQIVRCEADSSYTHLYLENGTKIVISRSLKTLENALPTNDFVRVHHSHLVNLNFISHFIRNGGNKLYMTNNDEIEVSRNRKKDLMEKINLI